MTPEIRLARSEDFSALSRMLELYQYDLSDIWDQELNDGGEFGYDLSRYVDGARFFAYVALANQRFAGFALVAPALITQTEGHWIEQFFVLKRYRGTGLGKELACHVFRNHPGPWEVGQMAANLPAQAFWRKVISKVTRGNFSEVQIKEGWWRGNVQRFTYETAA